MLNKKRFLLPVYLIIMCYLFIEIIFSEKSIFKFVNNSDLIKKKSDNLTEKRLIEKELSDFIENFKNNKDSFKNIELVLKKLKGFSNRKARFKTVISLIIDNKNYCFEGVVNGTIIDKPIGDMGFGYDSIFVANNMNKTFAEISIDEKNKISHRAIATNKLIDFINKKVF